MSLSRANKKNTNCQLEPTVVRLASACQEAFLLKCHLLMCLAQKLKFGNNVIQKRRPPNSWIILLLPFTLKKNSNNWLWPLRPLQLIRQGFASAKSPWDALRAFNDSVKDFTWHHKWRHLVVEIRGCLQKLSYLALLRDWRSTSWYRMPFGIGRGLQSVFPIM